MSVLINIESENLQGWVAEGTTLCDAARRLGVKFEETCADGKHFCVVKTKAGAELLSPVTENERAKLGEERIAAGERLGCETKAMRAGEVKIDLLPPLVSADEEEKRAEKTNFENLRAEFFKMPLEDKVRALVEFEAITAYQSWGFVLNLPSKILGKGVGVMANYGRKKDVSASAENETGTAAQPESKKDSNDDAENLEGIS
jgi:ferredoxin